jgi:4-amino-4-deoxy-L-arabinose transferase-like glycosyltransferase
LLHYHIARRPILWKIFAVALAIRWLYALLAFAAMGDAGLETLDSTTYVSNAHKLAQAVQSGALHGWQWIGSGPDTFAMPLFAWTIGLHALLFGKWTALAFVLTQGCIDAATCLVIYGIAEMLDPSIATFAGIAAALNPTQIILSGLVLTDTLFLFFAALSLLATIRWLRTPTWAWAAGIGAATGAAAMVRALMVLWMAPLVALLIIVTLCRRQLTKRLFGQIAVIALLVSISVAPVLLRNVSSYGEWSLTPQGGIHLAYWIVPLVEEARDGTPWPVGYARMQKEMNERYPVMPDNPFEQSRHYATVAREKLAELGSVAVTKAWMFGAALNLAAPAATMSPLVSTLPRTGFYATSGTSMPSKVFNFLFRSGNPVYTWTLLLGIAGLIVFRLIQLWGLVTLSGNVPIAMLFLFWTAFILTANGPVASPKYRLPIEPVLMVLTGAGLSRLLYRRRVSASP